MKWGVCGGLRLRAAVRSLYPTAERGDTAAVDGKTNHALEVGEVWVTRIETHAQPMRMKAISHGEAAATMSEELQLKRSHTYLFSWIVVSATFVSFSAGAAPTKRSRPDMAILLKPVVQYIETWRKHGITVQTPSGCIKYYARLVVGVFDAPAECIVLCEKQYNGECGCSACLHLERGFLMVLVYICQTSTL